MTKRIVFIIAFLLLSSKAFGESKLAIPERDTLPTKSERLYLDLAFGFDFDNTEYLGSDLGVSETLFGISLAPSLRYEWNEKHSLAVGASAQKWFGSKRFVDDIKLVAYYKFKSPRFTALTGLFPRNELIGDYSEVFFTSIWKTKNNLVQGATLQYTDKFKFIADNGGFIIHAHPFREDHFINHIRLFPRHVHAVEIINACRNSFENEMAHHYADSYGLLHFAGSDNHCAGHLQKLAGVESDETINSVEEFISAAREGKLKVFTLENKTEE
jgi:hypothetical protein